MPSQAPRQGWKCEQDTDMLLTAEQPITRAWPLPQPPRCDHPGPSAGHQHRGSRRRQQAVFPVREGPACRPDTGSWGAWIRASTCAGAAFVDPLDRVLCKVLPKVLPIHWTPEPQPRPPRPSLLALPSPAMACLWWGPSLPPRTLALCATRRAASWPSRTQTSCSAGCCPTSSPRQEGGRGVVGAPWHHEIAHMVGAPWHGGVAQTLGWLLG